MNRQQLAGFLLAATLIAVSVPVFAERYADAVADYRAGHYKQAYDALRDLHKADPGNTRVTYYLAMAEVQLGKFEQARGHYGEVLTLNPESTEAKLAEEGLGYLPVNSPLDAPPRPVQNHQTTAQPTPAAKTNPITSFLKLDKTPATPPATTASDYPGHFEPSMMPQQAQTGGPVSAKTAREQQQAAAANNTSYPANNPTGMSPQDLMAMQMMMGSMGGNNNTGMNPMMMMYGMPQQGYDPNNPTAQQNPYQQMDPNIMSTMMMNQMLNNFSFMDNGNNK